MNISLEEAKKIQKDYFHKYSTTLNGMIKHHKIDANEFLDFVHDVNLDFLKKIKDWRMKFQRLKEKKLYLLMVQRPMQQMSQKNWNR